MELILLLGGIFAAMCTVYICWTSSAINSEEEQEDRDNNWLDD